MVIGNLYWQQIIFQGLSNKEITAWWIGNGGFLLKDFMVQQQHGCSDLTPRADSVRLQKSANSLLCA